MDDKALPIEAAEAGDIFGILENTVDALLQVAKAVGLQVNFAPGKTEAVLGLRGRGLAAARQRLAERSMPREVEFWCCLSRGRRGIKDRARVSQACVVSRLLHGAGTGLTLSPAQLRKVPGQHTRPLRRIAGHDVPPADGGKWLTAVETLVVTGQAPVQAHIAAARLRLAARMSLRGTPATQGLAQS